MPAPRVVWYLANLLDGTVEDEVALDVSSIESQVAKTSTTSGKIRVEQAPPNWLSAFDWSARMLVCCVEDGLRSTPLVGYRVGDDSIGPDGIDLPLVSLESLLEVTNVGDYDPGLIDEGLIAGGVASFAVERYGFLLDAKETGRVSEDPPVYTTDEPQTVAAALNALTEADGGPEWCVRLRWADGDRTRFVKTIVTGKRIGGDLSNVVVDGCKSRTRSTARLEGRLANRVRATGDGLFSTWHSDVRAGEATWEATVEVTVPPSTDDVEAFLERAAEKSLRARRSGVTTWAVTLDANAEATPRIGVDFQPGDGVFFDLPPEHYDPVPYVGTARLIGYAATVSAGVLTEVTPVFYETDEQDTDLPMPSLRRPIDPMQRLREQARAAQADAADLRLQVGRLTKQVAQSQGTA